jgi:hypothetical protein
MLLVAAVASGGTVERVSAASTAGEVSDDSSGRTPGVLSPSLASPIISASLLCVCFLPSTLSNSPCIPTSPWNKGPHLREGARVSDTHSPAHS